MPCKEGALIAPPPGLLLQTLASDAAGVPTRLPEPKIAYAGACEISPPPGLSAEALPGQPAEALAKGQRPPELAQQAAKTGTITAAGAAKAEGEGPGVVRFCVFCGMRVAPKLVNARFCVYCGNVHSGQLEEQGPDAIAAPLIAAPLQPRHVDNGAFGWQALAEQFAASPAPPPVSDAILWQRLAAYMSNPLMLPYEGASAWPSYEGCQASPTLPGCEAEMLWQGREHYAALLGDMQEQ
mmetsp:Transcript_27272/g.82180  ORF Transcript_27272/g.82180 Transcript_27272/m.82180 type:complete len:239 (+) Transcript_27272:47-763(+)